MRVVLIGSPRRRDRLRWQLRDTGVAVVGEFATISEARDSEIRADALVFDPGDAVLAHASAPSSQNGSSDVPEPRTGSARDQTDVEPLTPRETEVIERLAEGLPNKAIADQLGISDQTVKFHVASITGKLGASNRTEAVRIGIRRGIITI